MREIGRRLVALESRRPAKSQRVVIVGANQNAPDDAEFVIRIVPGSMSEGKQLA